MITIISKKEGFRRCGIAHSTAPTTYPDDKFTKEELAALQDEPMLTVVFSEGEPSEKNRKGKEAKAAPAADQKAAPAEPAKKE